MFYRNGLPISSLNLADGYYYARTRKTSYPRSRILLVVNNRVRDFFCETPSSIDYDLGERVPTERECEALSLTAPISVERFLESHRGATS